MSDRDGDRIRMGHVLNSLGRNAVDSHVAVKSSPLLWSSVLRNARLVVGNGSCLSLLQDSSHTCTAEVKKAKPEGQENQELSVRIGGVLVSRIGQCDHFWQEQ